MKMRFLLFTLALIGLLGITDATAQKRKKKKVKRSAPVVKVEPPSAQNSEFKNLLVEANSSVEEPFIFVARNAEQYAELQKMVSGLPLASTIDFTKNAVVAAFAGTKPTPGYDITFTRTAGGLKVDLTAPPKDAMLAQVLTAPARVVLVPVEEQGLKIEAGANWQGKMQSYRITSGEINFSGGFAPIERKYTLAGTVGMMQSGNLVTLFFHANAAQDKARQMFETATGSIKENSLSFARIDAGSLIDNPRPPFRAEGQMNGNKIRLTFEPLPTNVADGYEGKGWLEAVLVK
jgi:hypothetical protein